jgi:hypothetical protein
LNQESGRAYYIFTLIAWLVYVVVYLFAPSSAAGQYALSDIQVGLLKLTVAIPLLLIWLVAVHGLKHLRRYTRLVKGSPDGRGFSLIFSGVVALVIGAVTVAISGQLEAYGLRHGRVEEAVIMHNYLQVLFPLSAFILTYIGTRRLIEVAGAASEASRKKWLVFLLFLILAPLYTWVVFNDPNRTVPTSEGVAHATHYLSDPLILFTLVMPYLFAWAMGIATLLNLWLYGRRVGGHIYRQALKRFILGMGFVVSFSIALQFLSTASGAISRLGLRPILALVYFLLAAYAIGYVLIASGSKQLAEIEEVK